MSNDPIKVITEFPRKVKEIENQFITLADGVKLAARIWLPEDAEQNPVPAILEFLPYRKRDGTAERDELTHPYYAGHGYACVRVDMRGSGESEGILDDEYLKIEQDNALEVLEWIVSQPWCSGNTGMIGISWGGFNGLQIAARKPSSLKAIVTIASTDDRYADDIHYMGGVMVKDNLSWGATMFAFNTRPPDPALVGDKWRQLWMQRLAANDPWTMKWLEHQTRDEFWQHGSVCDQFSDIECAVYAVGGWADGYSNAVPRLLAGLKSPAKGLIGPWAHKYPHFALPGPRIGFLQETLRWWDYWLKGIDTGVMDEPQYRVWMQDTAPPQTHYLTRAGRWVAEPSWPSEHIQTKTYHLNKTGLGEQPGETLEIPIHTPQTLGMRQGTWCGHGVNPDAPNDQREDDGCSIVFETEPLSEDMEILGAPTLDLQASADRPNAFIVARLSEVAADGAATRVTYGVLNLTHHDSHLNPEPLIPGQIYNVRVQLNDIAQTFRAGRRIRVALSNTMWPMFWPSPQPVTVTLFSANSTLSLPIRKARESDDQLAPFPEPESATPQSTEVLEPAQYVRRIERDETNNEAKVTVIADTGMVRLTKLGWEYGSVSRQYHTIREGDPNSAKAHQHWTMRFRRSNADMDVRTETYSTLTSNADEFIFQAELEAYEGEKKVYSNSWEKRVKRYLN